MPSVHLSAIQALKSKREARREETADGHSDELSSDEDDTFNQGAEDDSDVDEDESMMDGADPKSDAVMLLPSLFADRSPTVWMDYAEFSQTQRKDGRERIYEMQEDKEKQPLLYRSNHTIICLGGALKRSGFRRLLKGNTYNIFWGHHLKEPQLQKLQPNQYVNHFPGSYCLGRKDYLWRNISRQIRQHGAPYDFVAKTYVLPRDREHLEKAYTDGSVYIVKPPASAEGRGIRLVNRWEQMPKAGQPAVVQEYISNPYLIDGKKFDCRIYVAVTSFDPLRAYLYDEGLARFATTDYHADHTGVKSIKNRYMHLTNYSVNKKSDKFVVNKDADRDDEGSKWSLTALWKHLEGKGVDVPALKGKIFDIAVKTLIAAEHNIVSKVNQAGRPSCFELFGFDVLLDDTLRPWLIEVNVACSLASSSPLDRRIKHFMMTDLLHLVGIEPFDRKRMSAAEEKSRKSRLIHGSGNERPLKQRNIFELRKLSLQELDASDLDIIATAEDEHSRRGGWQRIFPCEGMGKAYLPFFQFPRYRNTVLAKWMERPDWSLLQPLLHPSLPADHPLRKLCAERRVPPSRGDASDGSSRPMIARRLEEARRQEEARRKEELVRLLEEQAQQRAEDADAAAAGREGGGGGGVGEGGDFVGVGLVPHGGSFAIGVGDVPGMMVPSGATGGGICVRMAVGCTTGARAATLAPAVGASTAGMGAVHVSSLIHEAGPGAGCAVASGGAGHSSSLPQRLEEGGSGPSVPGAAPGGVGASAIASSADAARAHRLTLDGSSFSTRLHALMRRTGAEGPQTVHAAAATVTAVPTPDAERDATAAAPHETAETASVSMVPATKPPYAPHKGGSKLLVRELQAIGQVPTITITPRRHY